MGASGLSLTMNELRHADGTLTRLVAAPID